MFFIPGAKICPVMMSIQIHARGGGGGGLDFFFIKMVQYGAFRVSPNTLYVITNVKINNFQANFPQY